MLEKSIVILSRHRLKTLKYLVADKHSEVKDIQNVFHQLTGLTSLRFVENNGLPPQVSDELVLIDNLAILTIKFSRPELMHLLSKETQNISEYMDMPAKKLLDLIFKEGGRFGNKEAVAIAKHRGLLDSIDNESLAYEKLAMKTKRVI